MAVSVAAVTCTPRRIFVFVLCIDSSKINALTLLRHIHCRRRLSHISPQQRTLPLRCSVAR